MSQQHSGYVSPGDDPRSVAELVRAAIAETDEDRYWYLVQALQLRGSREVFEVAKDLAHSSDADARALAADVLGQVNPPDMPFRDECVETLIGLLQDEDVDVVSGAATALGHLNDPRAVEPLIRLKSHPDADVRFGVTFGLLALEDERAICALIELSSDGNSEVRNWATFGLAQQIETDTPEIREALWRRIDDGDAEIRGEALVGLAKRADRRVAGPLIRELERIAAAEERYWDQVFDAASELADPELCPYLLKLKEQIPDDSSLDDAIAACCKQLSARDVED